MREALELATQKSAAGRQKALEALCGALLKRYCPDFIENQQVIEILWCVFRSFVLSATKSDISNIVLRRRLHP